MIKRIFTDDGTAVGTVLSGNLILSGAVDFLPVLEPWLKTAISVGQLTVAIATAYYIIRKARAVRVARAMKRKR